MSNESNDSESTQRRRRDRIAQWAFDTRPVLSRFHVWLEDVEHHRIRGPGQATDEDGESFVGNALERAFVTATAVTALGTFLFGRYGEGALGTAATGEVSSGNELADHPTHHRQHPHGFLAVVKQPIEHAQCRVRTPRDQRVGKLEHRVLAASTHESLQVACLEPLATHGE